MKNLFVSDETATFLTEFVHELETQDNRATADPYYFVVRGVRELSAREGQTNDVRFYYNEQIFTDEELVVYCKENELNLDEVKDECESFDIQEIDEYVNVFFTFEGYKQHMKLNGHNYGHYKRVDSYVMHAWRNPEIKKLLEAVKEIVHSLKGQ